MVKKRERRKKAPGYWEYGEDLPIKMKVEYWRRVKYLRPKNWKAQLKRAGITLKGTSRKRKKR